MKNSIIKYFRECYLNDNKEMRIKNIFSSSIENLSIIDGREDLLTRTVPYQPIAEEDALELSAVLKKYQKEKELFYFSFLLLDKQVQKGKTVNIAAPIFLFNAELTTHEEIDYIDADTEFPIVNSGVLSDYFSSDDKYNYRDIISDKLIKIENYDRLGFVIDEHFESIDTESLIQYPQLFNEAEIKKAQKKAGDFPKIIPVSGYFIIKKSGEGQGILNELDAMSKEDNFSSSLNALFGSESVSKPTPEKIAYIPTILNKAQENIIQSLSENVLNFIVGPPGTGKTYTIAAMAFEQVSKGKSVLIVSRTDQAVDVIAEKIENEFDLHEVIVRAGKSQYLKDLKNYIENLMSGMEGATDVSNKDIKKTKQKIEETQKYIAKVEKIFDKQVNKEKSKGEFLFHKKEGLFSNLKYSYLKKKSNPQYLMSNIADTLEDNYEHLIVLIKLYFKLTMTVNQNDVLAKNRESVANILKALRARTGLRKEEYFKKVDNKILFKIFPIWLVKMKDIYKVLPNTREMFDVAIIDEATQCDIASCLPIFNRAKKIVVCGDPKQLRHISFLPTKTQENLFEKFNLDKGSLTKDFFDYRNNSIIDIVNFAVKSQSQISFLNEHFRSCPSIIRFSNKEFYANKILLMTNRPGLPKNQGLNIIECNSKRDENGVNHKEAEAIFKAIKSKFQLLNENSNLKTKSIGILSPFRDQVEHFKQQAEKMLGDTLISKCKLLIGTAYEFQGEERDIMYISLALDNSAHSMAFRHLSADDVFNVSITRAREEQNVFISFNPDLLADNNLLRKYLRDYNSENENETQKLDDKDKFLAEVRESLLEKQYQVHEGFSIAGQIIDLVVEKNDKILGIDLIGYPGEYQAAFDLEKYKILRRAGMKIFPISYAEWVFNPQLRDMDILGDE